MSKNLIVYGLVFFSENVLSVKTFLCQDFYTHIDPFEEKNFGPYLDTFSQFWAPNEDMKCTYRTFEASPPK
jgi:hypothetical protein